MPREQLWPIVALAALVALALLLRQRHGNLYRRLTEIIERRTGWSMTSLVGGLAGATLLAWAVVYLLFAPGQGGGFESLLPGPFDEASEGAANPGSAIANQGPSDYNPRGLGE